MQFSTRCNKGAEEEPSKREMLKLLNLYLESIIFKEYLILN